MVSWTFIEYQLTHNALCSLIFPNKPPGGCWFRSLAAVLVSATHLLIMITGEVMILVMKFFPCTIDCS
jgi:hypothetical protein